MKVAMAHALGYAAGREDASGIKTADGGHPWRSGFILFAEAFAQGQDDYERGRRCSGVNAKDAYDRWQKSGGRSVFARGDLTLDDDQREELRRLHRDPDQGPYYARQAELQDAAWDAAGAALSRTGGGS